MLFCWAEEFCSGEMFPFFWWWNRVWLKDKKNTFSLKAKKEKLAVKLSSVRVKRSMQSQRTSVAGVCVCVCAFTLCSHKASHHPLAPRGRQLITPTKHIHTLYPSCHSAYSLPPAPASWLHAATPAWTRLRGRARDREIINWKNRARNVLLSWQILQ